MRLTSPRAGFTLLELLVAVTVASIVGISALGLLRQTANGIARGAARARAVTVAEESLGVSLAVAEQALTVEVLDDSAMAVVSLVADVVPCQDQTAVPLTLADGMTPMPGDRWFLLVPDTTTVVGPPVGWRASGPRPLRAVGDRCPVADSAGFLLRVVRPTRLVPYRGADGAWMLGVRPCAAACTAAQPIAGPLRSPASGGFRVRAIPCGIEFAVWATEAPSARSAIARRC